SRQASQSSGRRGRSNTRAPTSSVTSRARCDRVESRGILETGKVTGRVAGDDRANRAAEHLRAPRLRQRAREPNLRGLERGTEGGDDPPGDLPAQRIAGGDARAD